METLLEKDKKQTSKFLKPDFSTKVGRDFLAFYLQTKFKQILAYDQKTEDPIIQSVHPKFLNKFLRRLVNNPTKRIMIAITGESASGKTTICDKIKDVIAHHNMQLSIFSTDNYFNDISDKIKIYGDFDKLRDSGYDVDSPKSFQLDILKNDIEKLSNGENITTPEYILDGRGISKPNSLPVNSTKIIVAEGIATMYEDVKDIFDIKIYVDVDKKIQKKWFFDRASQRNQNQENAQKHWDYIQIAAQKYIIPHKEDADIVINGAANLEYFTRIVEYVYKITNNFQ